MKSFLITALLVTVGGISILFASPPTDKEWIAPAIAKDNVNPLKGNAGATQDGKKLFLQICAVCHGEKGKGDGIGGAALNPKPRNFTQEKTQNQTDGELFWKLSEGRSPMASYKAILTTNQRWQLVNFIRTLKK